MKKLFQYRSPLDNCVISKVYHDGRFLMYTVEKPWLSNKPFESCVPPGLYKFIPVSTPNHPNSFYMENEDLGVTLLGPSVRTACLWHIANFPRQVEGCAGPGLKMHPYQWGVQYSTKAMDLLNNMINESEDWTLEIK